MEPRAGRSEHLAMRWIGWMALWTLSAAAQTRITVTLYDVAGLCPEIREGMKRETAGIFLAAKVDLQWLECELAGKAVNLAACAIPLGPTRLMLQLIPGTNKTTPRASGQAVLQGGSGVFACLYPSE